MESAFPAFLGLRTDQFDRLRHFPADFFLEDFAQRDVRRAEIRGVIHQRPAQAAAAGIELAHAPRNEVDEDVRVANFFSGLFAEFSVHNSFWLTELEILIVTAPACNKKI